MLVIQLVHSPSCLAFQWHVVQTRTLVYEFTALISLPTVSDCRIHEHTPSYDIRLLGWHLNFGHPNLSTTCHRDFRCHTSYHSGIVLVTSALCRRFSAFVSIGVNGIVSCAAGVGIRCSLCSGYIMSRFREGSCLFLMIISIFVRCISICTVRGQFEPHLASLHRARGPYS